MRTALSLQREWRRQNSTPRARGSLPCRRSTTNGVLHRQGSQPASTNTLLQQHGWTSCTSQRKGAFYHQAAGALYSRNSPCSYHKRAALFTVHRVLFTAGYHMMTQGGFDISDTPGGYLYGTILYHTQVPLVMLGTLTLEVPSYLSIVCNKLLLHVFHTFSSFPLTLVIKFSLPNSCLTWCWVDLFLFSTPFHCAFHIVSTYVWLNYSASLTRQTCCGSCNDFHIQVWISFSVLLVIHRHGIHLVPVFWTQWLEPFAWCFSFSPSLRTPAHLKAGFLKSGQIFVYARRIRCQWCLGDVNTPVEIL